MKRAKSPQRHIIGNTYSFRINPMLCYCTGDLITYGGQQFVVVDTSAAGYGQNITAKAINNVTISFNDQRGKTMPWYEIALYVFLGVYSAGVVVYLIIKYKRGKKK